MKKLENTSSFIDEIVVGVRSGEKRLLARAISRVENSAPEVDELLNRLFPYTGNCYRIGITGPPGAGKSTLTSRLAAKFREKNLTVGIIAVDPTSPFSGGAVLGDRIRMTELATDPGVFIRSMATRGSLGGLSRTAQDVGDLMDAAGMDVVLFETVGVGQGELDVAKATDTTLVVLVPESGDSIQAMKAGLMEIADIFVINKSDREGANKLKIELEMMLHLRGNGEKWNPPIVNTIASKAEGVSVLMDQIQEHRNYLEQQQRLWDKRYGRALEKIHQMVQAELEKQFWNEKRHQKLEQDIKKVVQIKKSPATLVRELFRLK